jgi:hypothetical protein
MHVVVHVDIHERAWTLLTKLLACLVMQVGGGVLGRHQPSVESHVRYFLELSRFASICLNLPHLVEKADGSTETLGFLWPQSLLNLWLALPLFRYRVIPYHAIPYQR